MPILSDLAAVRRALDRDREWAAYAIGDLAPGFAEHCEWHATADRRALALVYRGFTPPIVFAMGEPEPLRALFHEIGDSHISLHLRRETIPALEGLYRPTALRIMRRMVLPPRAFRSAPHADVSMLSHEHLHAVNALYADGRDSAEEPTFFHPAMLAQGTFRGVWEDGALISIAGTHLYSPALGVCALGNVYTRRDRRGRGLAARVTSAVVARALEDRVPTIVLNVGCDNRNARRVYERLGFDWYCDFVEGEATRVV